MTNPSHEFSDFEDEPQRPDPSRLSEGMGADEVELETTFGPDVWDGPQGPLAEDIVAMRELERRGLSLGLFDELAGERELWRLYDQAEARGDPGQADHYLAALLVRDESALQRILDPLGQEGTEHGDATDGHTQEPDPRGEGNG